jgi:hypothetical protein
VHTSRRTRSRRRLAWSKRQLELAHGPGLGDARVNQHYSAAGRDGERVHVRDARPRQRQAKPPQAGQHAVGPRELPSPPRAAHEPGYAPGSAANTVSQGPGHECRHDRQSHGCDLRRRPERHPGQAALRCPLSRLYTSSDLGHDGPMPRPRDLFRTPAGARARPGEPPSPERLAGISKEVASGTYRIDTRRVAEAILKTGRSGPRG